MGAACVDILLLRVEKEKFFSGKYKAETISSAFGGDGLNEAVNLKRLGCDISFSFIAGNDTCGKQIRSFLDEEKITYCEECFRDDIDTYISLVLIDKKGERAFVGSENGSLRLYDLADVHIDDDCKILSFASLFISKRFDEDKYEKLFKSIKDKGIILCVDSSTPKNNEIASQLKYLQYIDYFFCNESEAKALCRSNDIFECERILSETGIANLIIKLGEKGCLYKTKIYPPKERIRCLDSTGAGDAFVSGFIYGLDKGLSIEECIEHANKCGGKACEYLGANKWSLDL